MTRSAGHEIVLIVVAAVPVALFLPWLIDTYTLSLLAIYAILALSLGLIWGYGGILCFGQAAFFGLGAYGYAIAAINMGESTLAVIVAVAVPTAAALILGAMMFYGRLQDVYLAIITLVVTLILYRFMSSTAGDAYVIGEARLGGFNGIPGFPTLHVPGDPSAYIWGDTLYYVCAVALVLMLVFVTLFLHSGFGRVAVGIRENEKRMALLGYDVCARKTLLFALGAAIAALAGALFATWSEIVTPRLFGLTQSAEIIIWCIVGGLGTRLGPVLGAASMGYLKFLLGQQALINNTLIMGLILIVVVLFLPRGLVPEAAGLLSRARAHLPRKRKRLQEPWQDDAPDSA